MRCPDVVTAWISGRRVIAHKHRLEFMDPEDPFPPQLAASDNLEDKFRKLEGNDVDDELANMKKGLKSGGSSSSSKPSNSLPEGRPIR